MPLTDMTKIMIGWTAVWVTGGITFVKLQSRVDLQRKANMRERKLKRRQREKERRLKEQQQSEGQLNSVESVNVA